MAQMKNRRIVLAARPAGGPTDTDFLLEVMEGGTVNEMVGRAPWYGATRRVPAQRGTVPARSPVDAQPEHRSEVVAYDQAESRRRIRVHSGFQFHEHPAAVPYAAQDI
jgi:hypothetical protein